MKETQESKTTDWFIQVSSNLAKIELYTSKYICMGVLHMEEVKGGPGPTYIYVGGLL